MNTLRISKGSDISIKINFEDVYFIKEFCAKEIADVYKIEEMLSDTEVDFVRYKKGYVLSITALSHFDSSVLNRDGFTLSVDDGESRYDYYNCYLKERVRDINGNKPITDKYTIIAQSMRASGGA
ncbi:MAG: hypothetical protein IJO20_05685 [Ruminococcus sp.]|nr:hypothetical protein [Ruminococcus sp.]MBQ7133970.1 hypothetical protein [Ruminococcus sp.]